MQSPTRPWRVWVTRPEPQAADWVRRLAERGWQATACPLLELCPLPLPAVWPSDGGAADVGLPMPRPGDTASVRAALSAFDALMFVSAQAVDFFWAQALALSPAAVSAVFASVNRPRCWGPGPATAVALRAAGVPDRLIDTPALDAERFDSDTLWSRVCAQAAPGRRLLLVRGALSAGAEAGPGRDGLAQRWRDAGGAVAWAEVYQRQAPEGLAARLVQCAAECSAQPARPRVGARGVADTAVPESVWLFTSGEALAVWRRHAPSHLAERAWALVTHPRLAAAAQAAGFERVCVCRATFDDVCRALESVLTP